MESSLLRTLRNRETATAEFRTAADALMPALFTELTDLFRRRNVDPSSVVLVVILRSAMAMLHAAMHAFPSAPIAVAGLKRDEQTAVAHWYYENFPPITQQHIIVLLDPMLATGGSAEEAVLKLRACGADLQKIYFVGVIAAPEGVARLSRHIPKDNIVLAVVDEGLDAKKYIVPGLGDFGDRYFGYPS